MCHLNKFEHFHKDLGSPVARNHDSLSKISKESEANEAMGITCDAKQRTVKLLTESLQRDADDVTNDVTPWQRVMAA